MAAVSSVTPVALGAEAWVLDAAPDASGAVRCALVPGAAVGSAAASAAFVELTAGAGRGGPLDVWRVRGRRNEHHQQQQWQ
jgi:hypothetical protein